MKIDIFCEVQKAKESWGEDHEQVLIQETLEQARLADELGYSCWWEVEHHAAGIFSHSSAPEIMLTTIANQTKNLRVGHAAVLAPFNFNHPVRVAERAAFLDHVSQGRLEVGLARSTAPEWRLFNIPPDDARDQMQEAFEMLPKIWDGGGVLLGQRELPDRPPQHRSEALPEARTRGSGRRSAPPAASSRPDATASACCSRRSTSRSRRSHRCSRSTARRSRTATRSASS